MSDEESFVILGTSPMQSLERDGDKVDIANSTSSSAYSDGQGSCFSSLKNSQLNELQNARQLSIKTPTPSLTDSKEEAVAAANISQNDTMQRSAESLLWSKPQAEVKDVSLDLEDCAITASLLLSPKTSLQSNRSPPLSSSPLNRSLNDGSNKENVQPTMNSTNKNMSTSQNVPTTTSLKTSLNNNSLASSFIMGEVTGDVLKSSVYSQFPSISMQACAEDVLKLQNMVADYMQLKTTLEMVNNTMKLFYTNSLEWKTKMNNMEMHYKQQLNDCQQQIEVLRAENSTLKKSVEEQIEQTKAVDVARQKDREDMIKTISEKTSLVENMRAQIVKLEQQHTASFEFIPKKSKEKSESNFDDMYITRGEHELIVKDLRRQLSELLAANLDFKDVEKQYIDELNCLKVNLTAAEELIKQNRSEIAVLQASDIDKQKKIEELQRFNSLLTTSNSELKERIILLEQQNEVYRKDFEMERESRQTAMGEKHQVLQDLRALQERNQKLIEERQKLIDNYERRVSTASSVSSGGSTSSLLAAAAAAQVYMNNPQRPIRDLTPPFQSGKPSATKADYKCPVCNKGFSSLSVVQNHVNDCIDRT